MAIKKFDHEKLIKAVAKTLCKVEGEYDWRYLKNVKGNPSTAWKYEEYLKMATAVIKALQKTRL